MYTTIIERKYLKIEKVQRSGRYFLHSKANGTLKSNGRINILLWKELVSMFILHLKDNPSFPHKHV